jgi:hypothetical protein
VTPHKPIFIESKVGAVLGERQLKNYIDSGTEILVAITRNWPEVPRTRLAKLGINHLRWQDVSRHLSGASGHRGKDRFLCDAFLEFLEYSNMAYREDITLSRLEEVRELLAKIGNQEYLDFVPGSSFALADSCLSLLRDARRIAQEEMPKLTECRNWGPGYYHLMSEDDPPRIEWHVFGFEMYRQSQYNKSRLLCGLCFSALEPTNIHWLIAHRGSVVKEEREVETPAKQLTSRKALDADLLARSIRDAAMKWKPF